MDLVHLLIPPRHPNLYPTAKVNHCFCQCGKCSFWMKSEQGMAEKKGRMDKQAAVPKLRAGYTETSWQKSHSATEGSQVTRGRKWRYSSNANVGSPNPPSAPKSAVKT